MMVLLVFEYDKIMIESWRVECTPPRLPTSSSLDPRRLETSSPLLCRLSLPLRGRRTFYTRQQDTCARILLQLSRCVQGTL